MIFIHEFLFSWNVNDGGSEICAKTIFSSTCFANLQGTTIIFVVFKQRWIYLPRVVLNPFHCHYPASGLNIPKCGNLAIFGDHQL